MTEEELNKIYVIGIGLRKFKRVIKKIRKVHPHVPIFATSAGYLSFISPTHSIINRRFQFPSHPRTTAWIFPDGALETQKLKELQLCRSFVIAGMPKGTIESIEEKYCEWTFIVRCPSREKCTITLKYKFGERESSRCEFKSPGIDEGQILVECQFLDHLIPEQRITDVDGAKFSRELQKTYSRAVLWAHGHAVLRATGVFHPLVNAK